MTVHNVERRVPVVGMDLKGYEVLANYRNSYILARSRNRKSPEPFVVWTLDGDGDPYGGHYCADVEVAEIEFASRCFPWFDVMRNALKEHPVEAASAGEVLVFSQQYATHRIALYKGWMIVQPADEMDGEIRCYAPSVEWEDTDYPDLEYLKDFYTTEWDAGTLQEAVDFIDDSTVLEYGASAEDVTKAISETHRQERLGQVPQKGAWH